ncbi:MAG: DUF4044 domain-containing protein [Bacilli bacterium]|nr:DUF4044 domain-containing protein [Bacilli bacterium]MCI9586106.1 DUF4044 domain-containing protein [Bacilli bacterium]
MNKNKQKQKKNINWNKLFTKIMVWLMLIVMIAFFISSIVWGLN